MQIKCETKEQERFHVGWREIIADAENKLHQAKVRQERLKASIGVFKRKMEQGDPVPDGIKVA